MYEIHLERTAQRDLKKLTPDVFRRIDSYIRPLAENPRPVGCRKIVDSGNAWRIRIGDYRVVYEVDDREKVVRIMYIRHRREVYR